ncbi:MAG: sterol desaturase family protein [Woeseiaceae bacterium]
MTWLVDHESLARLGVFLMALILFGLLEHQFPRRALHRSSRRWINLLMPVTAAAIGRLLGPLVPVAVAWWANAAGFGMLHLFNAPLWLAIIMAFALLDLSIYWQHRMMHKIPILWRLHRMHHSDINIDVTTGVRFHPLEFLLSFFFKSLVVLILGAPVVAVILFEIVLNAAALFNHSNLALSRRADSLIRWLLITPDLHRIHHSAKPEETNTNFGFSVPWWDHLFNSYKAEPVDGHSEMMIGLEEFRSDADQSIVALLKQPGRS